MVAWPESLVALAARSDNKELGQWAGLCKVDKDGNPRKVPPLPPTEY